MELTTLCYIEQNDRYLMLHRVKKQGDLNEGKWLGVGGHFEAGESPEDCMMREVLEETGLAVTSFRFRGIVTFAQSSGYTEYMHLFTADAFDGELRECSEGDLAWVKKEEIDALPLWEGDHVFLRLLREDRPFFSLKLFYDGDRLVSATLDGEEHPIKS